MKQAAIFTPSGRSTTLTAVVYTKITAITANATVSRRWPACCAASVTAIAAEVMSARTPVA